MTADTRVAIVGLGYVGLPLALAFVEAGLEVVGVDARPVGSRSCRPADRRSTTSRRAPGGGLARRLCDPCTPTTRTWPRRRDVRVRPDADQRGARTLTSAPSSPRPRGSRQRAAAAASSSCSRDDVPGHDDGPLPHGARVRRARRRPRLRPRVRARAGQPRRPGERQRGRPAPRRRRDARRPRPAPPPSCARSTTASSSCPRRTRPRPPSCSRTSSGT